jgi:hypothetical protein
MSDIETVDLPETEQATGLDAILDKALSAAEAPPETDNTDSGERARDKSGRFAPKETTEAEPSKGASEAKAAEAPPVVDPAQQQIAPHDRWDEARKAKFSTLPPEAKQFAIEVQREHEANFTRKSQEFAEFKRTADPLMQAVQPFQQYLAQVAPGIGQTPQGMINAILGAEYQLRTGTTAEVSGLRATGSAISGRSCALSRGEIAQPDPLFTQLRQQVQDLSQWRSQYEQQTAQEQQNALSLHIDTFAKAKDESGKPRYPHFERVRGIMGQMMANGQVTSLEDAYAEATKPIQEAIAAELSTRQAQSAESNKAALEKAKKAAPIRSSGTQPNGSAKGKGLDAHLDAAMTRAGIN